MKVSVFVSVIVIQVITCEKPDTKLKRKLIAPKMNENCKKIKCPTVEDPRCVRLKRHDLSLTFHMIVANECELEYLKCHDAVEGKIIPLKFCGQHAVLTAEKHKNEQVGTAHFRPKRTAIFSKPSAEPKLRKAVKQENSNDHKIKDPKIKRKRRRKSLLQGLKRIQRKHETRDHRQMLSRNETRGHGRMQRKNQIRKGLGKHARQSLGYFFSSETDSDIENNERKKLEKGIGGYHINMYDEKYSQLEPKSFSPLKGTSSEIDMEQYAAACPTVCPSRDVMVCGKCQHGIYRTFSSDCHMRMYGCSHPTENVQLISRVPCVQSSPFLSEPSLQPRGRLAGPENDDIVLRFISCRDKGLMDMPAEQTTGDPQLVGYTYLDKLNYYYKYHKTKMTWDESKKTCELEGASLYYPENKAEYDDVLEFYRGYEIGSNRPNTWVYLGIRKFNDFETIDGKPISEVFMKWRPGQPDNAGGVEDCVHMNLQGLYNDIICAATYSFICKKSVPTSSSIEQILQGSDPRCNFEPVKKTLKFYDHKGAYDVFEKQLPI